MGFVGVLFVIQPDFGAFGAVALVPPGISLPDAPRDGIAQAITLATMRGAVGWAAGVGDRVASRCTGCM